MASEKLVRIKQRIDTAASWESANPTLAAGELGIESDTNKIKIGDGATAWNDLVYKPGVGTAQGGEIFNSATSAGANAHAEGSGSATGVYSHAEGAATHADSPYSHAEGNGTAAMADYSHAEGYNSKVRADANVAHVEGWYTVASSSYQHVQGKCNIEDNTNTYAHIVGNGNNPMELSNAHTLDWDGNAWFAGNVTVGGTYNSETKTVDGAKTLATEEVIERIKYYDDPDIIPSDENYFTVNETGETITGLKDAGKTQTELVIPYKINGKEITTLYSGADSGEPQSILKGSSPITKITIPKSVTTLGRGVFFNCTSLTSINIPDSVTSIGNNAFSYCSSLTSIDIPDSVKSIGGSAFSGCIALTSIDIPNSVTSIGDYAFSGCIALTSIDIPNSVTSIESGAFHNCTNLTIYCEQGSYAETYAKENNIPIVYTDVKVTALAGQKTVAGGEIFNDYTNNKASAYSHAEGKGTTASGSYSHAEGQSATASGRASHAEGYQTIVGTKAFVVDITNSSSTDKKYKLDSVTNLSTSDTIYLAHGSSISSLTSSSPRTITAIDTTNKTITVDTYITSTDSVNYIYVKDKPNIGTTIISINADYAHAEGSATIASGGASHAEGSNTKASGNDSHAEGDSTTSSGLASHAEGTSTIASGTNSHAEGFGTIASKESQHVQGKYNIKDITTNGYAHIVGNGSNPGNRSNAHTLDWNGNAWFAGNVTVGGTYNSETGVVDGAKTLATTDDIISASGGERDLVKTEVLYKYVYTGTDISIDQTDSETFVQKTLTMNRNGSVNIKFEYTTRKSSSNQIYVRIYKNGTVYSTTTLDNSDVLASSPYIPVEFVKNDTIRISFVGNTYNWGSINNIAIYASELDNTGITITDYNSAT